MIRLPDLNHSNQEQARAWANKATRITASCSQSKHLLSRRNDRETPPSANSIAENGAEASKQDFDAVHASTAICNLRHEEYLNAIHAWGLRLLALFDTSVESRLASYIDNLCETVYDLEHVSRIVHLRDDTLLELSRTPLQDTSFVNLAQNTPLDILQDTLHPYMTRAYAGIANHENSILCRALSNILQCIQQPRARGTKDSKVALEDDLQTQLYKSASISGSQNVDEETDLPGKGGINTWRLGPGRCKSWKACPQVKLPTRRGHRRGKQLPDTISTSRVALKQQLHQRFMLAQNRSTHDRQKDQHGNRKQRQKYSWKDSLIDILDDDVEEDSDEDVDGDLTPAVPNKQQNPGAKTSFNLRPMTLQTPKCHIGSKTVDYVSIWANKPFNRLVDLYHQDIVALPERLPTQGSAIAYKRHRQRGLNKFSIPQFDNFPEFSAFLTEVWIKLGNKLITLTEMVDDPAAAPGSYTKLRKTIQAQLRQISGLSLTWSAAFEKEKRRERVYHEILDELSRGRQWARQAEQKREDELLDLPWLLRKRRHIGSRVHYEIKAPPRLDSLRKCGIIDARDIFVGWGDEFSYGAWELFEQHAVEELDNWQEAQIKTLRKFINRPEKGNPSRAAKF